MPLKIKQDHSRFREIIRGRIKENLRKYIQKGEMIGKKGKDLITIPVPSIDIPHFRYGHKDQGGVGQGTASPGPCSLQARLRATGRARRGRERDSTRSKSISPSTSWRTSSARSWRSRASRARARRT